MEQECIHCHRHLPIAEFDLYQADGHHGRRHVCRQCMRDAWAVRYAATGDARRAKVRARYIPRRRITLAERFWAKVAVAAASECWPFQGARNHSGHGHVTRGGGAFTTAHRLAWELTNGPVTAGLMVCHRCREAACCNPEHLYLGTQRENMADTIRDGTRLYGERNPSSKLTAAAVLEIRARVASGASSKALAREYGVKPGTISDAVGGRTWTHLPVSLAAERHNREALR